jgi:hypothetical protein
MGSAPDEKGRQTNEDPPHQVTIAKSFAVSKYELTFDSGYGRGQQPVINVTWENA